MKPSVLIELDRPRNIRITTNALVKVEDVLGRPLSEIGAAFGMREIRAFLWAGLLHEDRKLSLDDVGELIDDAGIEYVTGKVTEALNLSLGIKSEGDAADPN